MIQMLKRLWFATAKTEAKMQTELIRAIRSKMEAIPQLNKPGIQIWRVGAASIIKTKAHDLVTIAILNRADDGSDVKVLMSWMEVDGEITNMDRRGFTTDQLVLLALS